MKKLVRHMLASVTAPTATSPVRRADARLAAQRAAVAQGALVDVRHG